MSDNLLKYTDREYLSIFQDLYAAIPHLTSEWTTREETDPGIVLLKLMSMLGDMLSYNQDRQSLEVFPNTVSQRKNADQLFSLLGYRLHWYVSATCTATFKNNDPGKSITIDPYHSFSTSNGITYSNLSTIRVNNGGTDVTLTQGIPVLPPRLPTDDTYEGYWYDRYATNISADEIVNSRYYLPENTPIAEDSVFLVDDTGVVWRYPNSTGSSRIRLNLESDVARFFEICIDEYNTPYIQFPESWNKATDLYEKPSAFKLFYLKSLGKNGTISANTLVNSYEYLVLNERSYGGSDPETPEEARHNLYKYQNTLDTLITLDDFRNATMRVNQVINCIATDLMTDPYMTVSESNRSMINLYVIPSPFIGVTEEDYRDFKESIHNALNDFTCLPHKLNIYLPEDHDNPIEFYNWIPDCEIYLTEPVEESAATGIISDVSANLSQKYRQSSIEFNTPIDYFDLLDTIKNSNRLIRYVRLSPITYTSAVDGGVKVITENDITGKISKSGDINNNTVTFDLGDRIKPGSVTIDVIVGLTRCTVRDIGYADQEGKGKFTEVSFNNKLESGYIDYLNGTINLVFHNSVSSATVMATRNKIGICYYNGDTRGIQISRSSLKL